ncbi:MAG: SdrD B-like domain-containing protein, partial [Usitatibacteraceae bacterium]
MQKIIMSVWGTTFLRLLTARLRFVASLAAIAILAVPVEAIAQASCTPINGAAGALWIGTGGSEFFSVNITTGKATLVSTNATTGANGVNALGYNYTNDLLYYVPNAPANNTTTSVLYYNALANTHNTFSANVTAAPISIAVPNLRRGTTGGGGFFFGGNYYLGLENVGTTNNTESRVYAIPVNAAGIAPAGVGVRRGTAATSAGASPNEWGDYVTDGTTLHSLGNTLTGTGIRYVGYNLATGALTAGPTAITDGINRQVAIDRSNNIFLFTSAAPINFAPYTPNSAAVGTPVNVTTNGTTALNVALNDAAGCVPAKGVIGDKVFYDTNGNGVFDVGEPAFAGVTLQLYDDLNGNGIIDAGETLLATTTTNATGDYQFANLLPGQYLVRVVVAGGPLAGLTGTTGLATVAGDQGGVGARKSATVALNQVGQQNLTVDFAFRGPSLTKTFAPTNIGLGQTSTLTFFVSNPAGVGLTTFSFTDTLPAGLAVGTGAVGGTCTGGTVTATAGTNLITVANRTVAAGATTCTITVPVTTSATPSVGACPLAANTNNTGNITGTNAILNQVTAQCLRVTPSVNKAFLTGLAIGGTAQLRFTVTSTAASATQTFSFTDTLPAGLVVGTGGITSTCTAGTSTATPGTNSIVVSNYQIITGSATCTIDVPVTTANTPTVGVCPQANNTNGTANFSALANLGAVVTNSVGGGGTSTTGACVTVVAAVPTLNKAFAAALPAGGTTQLVFTITQPATNPTQSLSFTDTLPAGLRVAAVPNVGGTCTGGGVTATALAQTIVVTNRQIVNPATTCTIQVDVTTAAAPTIGSCPSANNTNGNAAISATTNITAAIANSAAGGGTSTTGACVSVPGTDVSVAIIGLAATAAPGAVLSGTITCTNIGAATAVNATCVASPGVPAGATVTTGACT